jgi:OOP family OmpA-OmpF porin
MRRRSMEAVSALLAFSLAGCATLREHPTACKVAAGLTGAALGGLGGGLGVSQVENGPDDGEIAGGTAAGVVAGSIIGFAIGHFVCQAEEAPPPPPALAPPPAAKRIETLYGPSFDFDKASLKPSGITKVDHAAQVLKDTPNARVLVEGHTDSIGSPEYNQRLSERRAKTVRDRLVEDGISASRITTHGLGESKPIASNATEEGRAENRRVEILSQ